MLTLSVYTQFHIYNIYKMSSGQLFQCPECDQEFTLNHNLTHHIKRVHGNQKREDNETRKEVILKRSYLGLIED